MNLMFRKNFREQKSGGGSKGLKSANRHANKRSNRDQGYSPIEEHHYRTHLFFSPPRCSYSAANDDGYNFSPTSLTEPRCGPMTGAESDYQISSQSSGMSPALTEADLPQPLIVRSTSDSSMLKWPPQGGVVHPTRMATTPTRQVSFSCGKETINSQSNSSSNGSAIKCLSGLERDCFIIPVHSLDRFLPAGVPLPKPLLNSGITDRKSQNGNLHVMEVPDPKLCILCHLMSPLEPIDPMLESPLLQPALFKQRVGAGELLHEVYQAKTAVTGMVLANMERNAEFPFISYYVINASHTNPIAFYNNLRNASLAKFDPKNTRYTAAHTLDLYTEVASICRPPIHELGAALTKTHTHTTGYMVSVYRVFEGDDREIFERNWLYWTGARMIYRYLPARAGLRKISLHKSLSPKGDKMYLLLCECSNLLHDVTVSALILPALRARLTGYTGLYKPIQAF